MKSTLLWNVLLLSLTWDTIQAAKMIRFASPLQSLTIPDREVKEELTTRRQRFLPRFKAGLQAEVEARKEVAAKRTADIQTSALSGNDWAKRVTESDRARRAKEDEIVEKAYDTAVAEFDKNSKKSSQSQRSPNGYQFVGVVTPKGKKPVTWYARPKPVNSKWSVRLLHVNQDAVIKDLFNSGKVDIFAKYKNTGSMDDETKAPIITSTYEVRERSWK